MSNQSVKQECLTRASSIVSSKGVLQECHLSVSSQGVPQVGSLEVVTMSIKSLFLNIRVGIRVRGHHLVFGYVVLIKHEPISSFHTTFWHVFAVLEPQPSLCSA